MENVTLVMAETSNSYNDVMSMPLGAFMLTVKHIRLKHLMQNPKWAEVYAKWQYEQAYKQGKITQETETDIDGLLKLKKTL